MRAGPAPKKKMKAGGKVRKYANGGMVEIEIKVGKEAESEMEGEDESDMPVKKMKTGGAVPKNFIQGAIKKPGALRAQMGVKAGETIPKKKLAAAAKAPGKLGQRARFAQTLAKMGKK